MSDIFVSYDSEDRARAEPIVRAFEREGWSVFWDKGDKEYIPDDALDAFIANELDAVKCIVVLWSEAAMTSEAVKQESQHGMLRNNLISVLIDETWLPFGVDRIGSIDLIDWDGDPNDMAYRDLVRKVNAHIRHQAAVDSEAERAQRRVQKDKSSDDAKRRPPPFVRALQENKEFVIAGLIGVFVLGALFLVSQIVDDRNRVVTMDEIPSQTGRRSTSAVAPRPQAPWPTSGVIGSMKPLATDLRRKGFISYGSPSVGRLSSGGTAAHILTLGAGAEYVIAGACSNDCNDLDLALFRNDGRVAGVYEEMSSNEPTVNVASYAAETYRIEVRMVDCASGSCVYGISVFEKRGTKGH